MKNRIEIFLSDFRISLRKEKQKIERKFMNWLAILFLIVLVLLLGYEAFYQWGRYQWWKAWQQKKD